MRTTLNIMKTIAVHLQEHLEARPLRKWKRDAPGGKCDEFGRRKLLRTGKTGTAAPPNGKPHRSEFFSLLGDEQDEFDL